MYFKKFDVLGSDFFDFYLNINNVFYVLLFVKLYYNKNIVKKI
jgi:hypothetical protein